MSEDTTSTTPTPNSMPGASPTTPPEKPVADPPKVTEQPKAPEPSATALSADERAELDRLRAVHKDESKWENRSKANAKKLRDLAELAGIDVAELNLSEFDPRAEFEKLKGTVEEEREARIRAEVARDFPDLDPGDIQGKTEADMRASAQRQKDRIDEAVKKALEAKQPSPSAAPASTVTSSEKITGPKQIESRDELKKLSPADRIKAFEEGRLDNLAGSQN